MRAYIIFPKSNLSCASSNHSFLLRLWNRRSYFYKMITREASDEYPPAAVPLAPVQNAMLAHRAAYSWPSSDCLSVKHQIQNIKLFKPAQDLYHITLTWRWLWHPHHWTANGLVFPEVKTSEVSEMFLPAAAPLVVSDVNISTWYHSF